MICITLNTQVRADITGLPLSDAQLAHVLGSAYVTEYCYNRELNTLETMFVVGLVGVMKETYDSMNGKEFSVEDLSYNYLGFLIAKHLRWEF